MREGNIFSLSTLAGGGGYSVPGLDGVVPHPRSGWEGYPILVMRGYPIQDHDGGLPWGTPSSKTEWGTPHPGLDGVPPPPSNASACCAARGMPLAFTQEDFPVLRFSTGEEKPKHEATHF